MIHIFIGTKAQLVKMAPIMKGLQDRAVDYNFIYSGQHKATFKEILNNFGIRKEPDITLYTGDDITGIGQMARWAFGIIRRFNDAASLSAVFQNDHNGIVLNHGDTFSTLLGSYLAKKQGLKTGHVEAGLRSHNIFHPFPEELTRLMTFRMSDFFFAPGDWAMENLKTYKGIKVNTEHNTLYDSLMLSRKNTKAVPGRKYALVSIHRFENIFFKRRLTKIIDSLIDADDDMKKLFILHKPTEKKLREFGLYERLESSPFIELHPRYDYFDFMALLEHCEYLVTDGGSNQEECFYLGKPCLLMRKATERREGLQQNVVLGGYSHDIFRDFIRNYRRFSRPALKLERSPTGIIIDRLIEENFHH